ncbi:hypothetical protein [Salinimicrobium sp. HB62]|uniref:hypothetical protein n=1 Tax=Salinimicrobium sp. HB62 TaxID=3077781 RepID=UPI002D783F14|nr:hypothetical protein [Salinimicrobium sp. HB62]
MAKIKFNAQRLKVVRFKQKLKKKQDRCAARIKSQDFEGAFGLKPLCYVSSNLILRLKAEAILEYTNDPASHELPLASARGSK